MTDAKIFVIQGSETYYVARVPAFPGCNATGRTRDEAIANARKAFRAYRELLEARGVSVEHWKDIDPASLPVEDALAREIREETGLVIDVGPVLEVVTGYRWARIELVFAFRVTAGTEALTAEVAELGWFDPRELPDVRADQRGLIERHAARAREWAAS